MSKRLKSLDWRTWLYSLAVAVIAGTSQSVVTWLGMAGASAAGVDVPQLNFKSLGIIMLSACLFNLFTFLKQSPLPKPETDDETNPFPPAP